MNITKLSIWPDLQALGFEPINYRFNGRKVATGAALRETLTDISGKQFKTDIICIEPTTGSHSDKRNYHITGKVNTPYYDTFYRYEQGRKVSFVDRVERVNEFFTAAKILPTIQSMLK